MSRATLYLNDLSEVFTQLLQTLFNSISGNLFRKRADESQYLAVAKQTLGIISRIQRETGFRIITRYVGTDEEKMQVLGELCDFFNDASSSTMLTALADGDKVW